MVLRVVDVVSDVEALRDTDSVVLSDVDSVTDCETL